MRIFQAFIVFCSLLTVIEVNAQSDINPILQRMQEYVVNNDINNAISCCDSLCSIRDSQFKDDKLEQALISYAVMLVYDMVDERKGYVMSKEILSIFEQLKEDDVSVKIKESCLSTIVDYHLNNNNWDSLYVTVNDYIAFLKKRKHKTILVKSDMNFRQKYPDMQYCGYNEKYYLSLCKLGTCLLNSGQYTEAEKITYNAVANYKKIIENTYAFDYMIKILTQIYCTRSMKYFSENNFVLGVNYFEKSLCFIEQYINNVLVTPQEDIVFSKSYFYLRKIGNNSQAQEYLSRYQRIQLGSVFQSR